MKSKLQEGIYHLADAIIPKSFCILFLNVSRPSNAEEAGVALNKIWTMLTNLKQGIVSGLDVNPLHRYSGNLSVLIGYGPKLFTLDGIKKPTPPGIMAPWVFNSPKINRNVYLDCDLSYGIDIETNSAMQNDIVLQFIADEEFYVSRALLEVHNEIRRMKAVLGGKQPINLANFYLGYHRDDYRGWLGFHDGVSNLPSEKRAEAITIGGMLEKSDNEKWLIGGTYIAFMRITIDIDEWSDLSRSYQEIVIGRDKVTGCPIIGVDKNDNPIKDYRCPVRGTFEIIEAGNELFREHPPYGRQRNVPPGYSDNSLKFSHIGRTASDVKKPPATQFRIFRQGFEFLEPIGAGPKFRVGLNFVSFQKSTESFFNSLQYGFKAFELKTKDGGKYPSLEDYLSVRDAGIFFVPPVSANEIYPGSSLFFNNGDPKFRSKGARPAIYEHRK